MEEELLEQIQKLNRKVLRYKKILKAFDAPYINIIRLNNFDGERDMSQIVTLASEPELEAYIREYFKQKLEELEKEFAEIE